MLEHLDNLMISNASGTYKGLSPENVFVAYDRMGSQFGVGTIQYQYQPDLYPDRPHQLYIELDSQPVAQYMLLGALLGRAHQIWSTVQPSAPARVYAAATVADTAMQGFYAGNGFDLSAAQRGVRLEIPQMQSTEQMSMSVRAMSLNTPQEQLNFVNRLQMNGITDVNQLFLNQVMCLPHFLHLGLFHMDQSGEHLIGEVLLSGENGNAEVLAIYVLPAFRRRGLGRFLLHRAMVVAASAGVGAVNMKILTASTPQKKLAEAFHPVTVKDWVVFPSLNLDPLKPQ